MNFKELMHQLQLDSKYSAAPNQLEILKQWCRDNISKDLDFNGEPEQIYQDYQELAELYLDQILPNLPKNLNEPCEAFNNNSTLQMTAQAGFHYLLSSLSPNETEVNQANAFLMTPLHTAAMEGYYHTVKTLGDLGANPQSMNRNKQIPLFSALLLPMDSDEELKNSKTLVFQLLKKIAPKTLTHRDISGDSVLHLIAAFGFDSLIPEVMESAPELFMNPNNLGHYPIHTAILNNQVQCLSLFLKNKECLKLKDSMGETVLHYAALYGSAKAVSLCCEVFKEVDLRDNEGRTPLMLAAESGNTEAMKILIAQGADSNLKDNAALTLLHHAVRFASSISTAWVLDNIPSININALDNTHYTALDICEERRQINKAQLLIQRGARRNVSVHGAKILFG